MSVADEIAKLAELRRQGAIDDEEFALAKERALDAQWRSASGITGETGAAPATTPQKRMGVVTKIVLGIVGIFVAVMIFGGIAASSPEAKARQAAEDSIAQCWKEQGRKSLAPGSQRFIAGACEKMEADYRRMWKRNP